jgi:DNA-binding MarR family transcriptional regulator
MFKLSDSSVSRKHQNISYLPPRCLPDKRLTRADLIILTAVGSYLNPTTCVSLVSLGELAADTGYTTQTVKRAIRKLVALGYIQVARRTDEIGRCLPSLYHMIFTEEDEGIWRQEEEDKARWAAEAEEEVRHAELR